MRNALYVLFIAALVAFGAGCQPSSDVSPASTEPNLVEAEQEIDLNSPTGGLTATDEEPAFGEAAEFNALSAETAFDDPYANDAGIQEMIRARGARLFEFRAIWGLLANLSDTSAAESCPFDWSGKLHLEGGIVVIKKVIAFEPDDSITRVDRSTISWVSHTGPHIDGFHLHLIVPARHVDSQAVPHLEMSAGPFSRSFTLDELVALNIVEQVDTCGNAISIASVLTPPACPHGHLMGAWKATPPDTLSPSDSTDADHIVMGRFRGVWIGAHGRISGYLKGVYGLNADGERVFFGKYIDAKGHFMGILRGTYTPPYETALSTDAKCPPHRLYGSFKGEWIDKNYNVQGRLRGHWIAAGSGMGLFHGVWGMRCSDRL